MPSVQEELCCVWKPTNWYVHFVFAFLYVVVANQFVHLLFEDLSERRFYVYLSPAHVLVFLFAETLFDSFQ